VLEAAAAGVPTVATSTGGIPDIIQDGKNGLLVKPGSPDALAQGILELYRDRARGKELAGCAREYVREHFSETQLVDKTLALYQKLVVQRIPQEQGVES
jgi:glycosyltransferase involved in cell wall biosynthesis